MLTVWTMSTGGKYADEYPQRLQQAVAENLEIEHRFICIADHLIEGVQTMTPPTDYPGWWGKVGLFKPGVPKDLNLWLDLDVVITGDLTQMVELYQDSGLAMPTNWAQSGHGGCQSSVMIWRRGRHILPIYRDFKEEWAHWPPVNKPGVLWGDQEWITQLRDTKQIEVTPINESWVKSYKYHCRGGVSADCRVVVFHGKPDPHEVGPPWW
jgi:hypothetical protein